MASLSHSDHLSQEIQDVFLNPGQIKAPGLGQDPDTLSEVLNAGLLRAALDLPHKVHHCMESFEVGEALEEIMMVLRKVCLNSVAISACIPLA